VSGAGKTAGDTVGSATKGVSDTTKGEFFPFPTLCSSSHKEVERVFQVESIRMENQC
jgi:hypothetical protein